MRAEDLYKAMGELDEELIAGSDRIASSGKRKRRGQNSVYRFAVVAISAAAAVFLLLMARDFIGTLGAQSTKSSQLVSQEKDGAQEDVVMAGEAPDAAEAAEEDKAAGPDETQGKNGSKSEAVSEDGEASEADGVKAPTAAEPEAAAETESAGGNDSVRSNAEGAGADSKAGADSAADAGSPDGEKEAVDLMGDKKGDYISLEYISAEDQADGKSTTVPDYTPEGEEILSRAFDNGKPVPSMMANTGDPVYYVFLTKENGKVDTITFYENSYVSMDNYPGVVMRISQADYEDVMTLFR